MEHKQSELTVITKAKDLCSYVMTVTQKSPKQFRFTFTSRLQNLSLDVIEALYRAKDTFVTKENVSAREKRLKFQHQAIRCGSPRITRWRKEERADGQRIKRDGAESR